MDHSTSLLENLTKYMGFDYVSQLKFMTNIEKKKCAHFLEDIDDVGRYTFYEWNDACSYISKGELEWKHSAKEASENLINWLKE